MNLKKAKISVLSIAIIISGFYLSIEGGWTRAAHDPFPTKVPDHVILTWSDDPATTQSVTWRTDTTVTTSWAEISKAFTSPAYTDSAIRVPASDEILTIEDYSANYHSVTFTDLKPGTQYFYRVGSDENWSEWFRFRTVSETAEPFRFIYLGDGQTHLLSMWSNAIRTAYSAAPDARFILHGGDLVDHARSYHEWSSWFAAAGWIDGVVPIVPANGNHEYNYGDNDERIISPLWRPQFTLPLNGIKELPETNYYIDLQGLRLIVLNSMQELEKQADWLKTVLENNPNNWTIACFHHPLYSGTRGRNEKRIRDAWESIFENYSVDLVLNGHDHTYARGHNVRPIAGIEEPFTGPVYVVSVSGPKLYDLNEDHWMDRAAENTQLYHIITVEEKRLSFTAYTLTGELYDEFQLLKNDNGPNTFIDKNPGTPERTYKSTTESSK